MSRLATAAVTGRPRWQTHMASRTSCEDRRGLYSQAGACAAACYQKYTKTRQARNLSLPPTTCSPPPSSPASTRPVCNKPSSLPYLRPVCAPHPQPPAWRSRELQRTGYGARLSKWRPRRWLVGALCCTIDDRRRERPAATVPCQALERGKVQEGQEPPRGTNLGGIFLSLLPVDLVLLLFIPCAVYMADKPARGYHPNYLTTPWNNSLGPLGQTT